MITDFVNLHLHTDASILDGIIQIPQLVDFCRESGMSACAITDHGTLYNAITFYNKAKEKDIKPIIGQEFYIVDDHKDKNPKTRFHQVLLAKNTEGYRNLLSLTTIANRDGFYNKPCIDFELLKKYSKGLIATSCCLGALIPKAILYQHFLSVDSENIHTYFKEDFFNSNIVKLRLSPEDLVSIYVNIFKGDFYLEVMKINIPEQEIVNQWIFDYGKKLGIPIILTGDSHYLRPEDKEIHEISLCNNTKALLSDPTQSEYALFTEEEKKTSPKPRFSFEEAYAHTLTPTLVNDIIRLEPIYEEAAKNTLRIAAEASIVLQKKYTLPDFSTTENDANTLLINRSKWGLVDRFGSVEKIPSEYKERLKSELDIIIELGFTNYFLVVADYANWSKNNNILVGAGRGSAAGSVVCWSLKITEIDPIKYGLIFARFLNSGRKDSLPDIDLDWSPKHRELIINYLKGKYGEDRVAEICTFVPLHAKSAIKDVARVLDKPLSLANEIAAKVPDPGRGKTPSFEFAEQNPDWIKYVNSNPEVKQIVTAAKKLEGLKKSVSIHAGGVIISGSPIEKRAPLIRHKNNIITGFDMDDAESQGLIKFDILRVEAIETISGAIDSIKREEGKDIDILNIPLDDQEVFDLINKGKTTGIFQFDSGDSKSNFSLAGVAKEIQVNSLEDLSDCIALFRPGPLDNELDRVYIKNKKDKVKAND